MNNPFRRPLSLSARLTLSLSLATVLAFAAFTWLMIHSVERHFAEQDISTLETLSNGIRRVLQDPGQPSREALNNILTSYQGVAVLLRNADNRTLYRTVSGVDLLPLFHDAGLQHDLKNGGVFLYSPPPLGKTAGHSARGQTYRVVASRIHTAGDPRPGILLIALSINFHLHYIEELKHQLMLTAGTISLLIILIILFTVFKGHQPLREVSRKIKNITSKNLDTRLDPAGVPIELQQLVVSFNHMIARIENVFTRQANFSADIAHEMRTPITNLVTQTEIALSQRRTEKELEEILYSNLEEYQRMAKMVSDMLFLAQADNNQLIPGLRILDLREETLKVFDFFEAWAEECQVTLHLRAPRASVTGDALMLRRVINNLLSNAIRHTPAGGCVCVQINITPECVTLSVENPGPPIAAEHLPRLFDRFYRVDPSRQRNGEGSGIGLAIVKSIITAHRGEVGVSSDPAITRFTFTLPRTGLAAEAVERHTGADCDASFGEGAER